MKNKKTKDIPKPVQLYKFTSISTLCKILHEESGFRFSSVDLLNDPFEAVDIELSSIKDYKTLSFTRSHSSTLMWAHYGDSFGGCVIKIDCKKYNNLEFRQVKYLSRDIRKGQNPDYNKLLVKGQSWAYEREHRVLLDTKNTAESFIFKNNNYYFLRPHIKEICFGPMIKESLEYYVALKQIEALNNLAIKNRRKTKDYIKVAKYKISSKEYSLIKDKNYDYQKEIENLSKIKEKLNCSNQCNECKMKCKEKE